MAKNQRKMAPEGTRSQGSYAKKIGRRTKPKGKQMNGEEETIVGSQEHTSGQGANEEVSSHTRVAERGVDVRWHGEDGTSRDPTASRRSGAGRQIAEFKSGGTSCLLSFSSGAGVIFDPGNVEPVLVVHISD